MRERKRERGGREGENINEGKIYLYETYAIKNNILVLL